MYIDEETERKLQKIISGISNRNLEDAMEFSKLNNNEKEQFNYLLTMNFLFSQSAKFRGKVIDITIFLEMTLGQILADYFAKDSIKSTTLNAYVFDRMQLSLKFNLFKKILKNKHLKIWNKFQKELKEISELIDFRNNLAHSMLDSSEEYINSILKKAKELKFEQANLNEIQINYFTDNDFKEEKIKQTQIDDYYTNCSKKIKLIQEIAKLLEE